MKSKQATLAANVRRQGFALTTKLAAPTSNETDNTMKRAEKERIFRKWKSKVQVIGPIWEPGFTCAMEYNHIQPNDVRDSDGNITRESIEQWLTTHSGDFQSIDDFYADIADGDQDIIIDWASDESEPLYNSCMYPEED